MDKDLELLPMVQPESSPFQTCKWRCGDQCFTEESNKSTNNTFQDVLAKRVDRRGFMGFAGAVAGLGALMLIGLNRFAPTAEAAQGNYGGAACGLDFTPLAPNVDDQITVPHGYTHDVVIGWGDPLFADSPRFDFENQTAAAQARQFGYNCDYVSFMPLPAGSHNPNRGLMVVNHEYTNPELMLRGYDEKNPSKEHVDIEIAAHGLSVVEVRREHNGSWTYMRRSKFNRRVMADTPMIITGPAAGHSLMKTAADQRGENVLGVLNNCSGGTTPWGTVLTTEENFHQYFANLSSVPTTDARAAIHSRYGMTKGATRRGWEKYYDRFDMVKELNEAFRFGWIVEVDPYNPNSVPRKRTALGRFKHEAATTALTPEGRVVAYLGDDERFEYIYKFVSNGVYRPGDRAHNLTLLDEGILYVAKFKEDGTGEWLPLVHGEGPLTAANGFPDQATVLINTRGAADLLGATKMDRPEDIELNPVNGKVYAALTNNTSRTNEQVDAANPRPVNRHGHVLEWAETDLDPAKLTFTWEIFIKCGDPADPSHGVYAAGFPIDRISPISSPDNVVFDNEGNLWISTDGMDSALKKHDGIYVVATEGPMRGYLRLFLTGPIGAEICGPAFTPDDRTLFCAIQHPGEGGSIDKPTSTWPDGPGKPVRPAVVAVWREDNGNSHSSHR